VEVALRLVHVRLRERGAHVLEAEAVGGQRRRVRLDAHGGLLPAADADQPDAGELRYLLRQPRVRQVLDLRQRERGRGEGGGQDRRVGRVRLAVDGRIRQVAWE